MAKKPAAQPVAAGTNLFDHQAVELFALAMRLVPDVDEILRKAGLGRAWLRQLEYDDEISAAIETRLCALLSTPWRLEPGTGDGHDLCQEQLTQHIEPLLIGAFNARLYGYSVIELVWNEDRTLREAAEKPFEWFTPQRTGELLYTQHNLAVGVSVDTTYKFLLTRYRATYQQPRGEALLSRCYWPWFFRTHGWKFYAKFLERHGSPLLIGKGGNPTEMAKVLQTALASAVAAVGQNDSVEVVASANAGQAFSAFQSAQDKRVQKLILGQTLTTDVDGKGSYAAAKVHDSVREDRKLADIRMTSRTVQAFLNALCALNGIAQVPQYVMEGGEGLAIERAERDGKLVNAGIVKLTEQYLLDRYDFEEGDFEIPEGAPPPAAGKPGKAGPPVQASKGRKRFTADQEAVETLVDRCMAKARSPIQPGQIRAAIRASKTPEQMVDKLAKVFGDSDPSEFRELVERALFAADVMGYAHADTE